MAPLDLALKHRDIEEPIDLYVYRPIGARIARRLVRSPLTPNYVTVASGIVGMISGHLFLYESPLLTACGVGAYVAASLLDSVDGQLARLTGATSRVGKILDGAADGATYASIYAHVAIRIYRADHSALVFLVAAIAFASLALQNSISEYYRHAYLACALPGGYSSFESQEQVRQFVRQSQERAPVLQRFLLGMYRDWVVGQELLAPVTARLHQLLARLPEADARRLDACALAASLGKPLLKYLALLATNLRMLMFFALLVAGRVTWFFPLTIVGLNIAMVALLAANERNSRTVLARLAKLVPSLPGSSVPTGNAEGVP